MAFPTEEKIFSFANPNSSKNTILNPHDENGELSDHGRTSKDGQMIFDTSLIGKFSNALVTLKLNKANLELGEATLKARKAYRAYLLPEGEPIGFPEGTLLKNADSLFLVSNGQLKEFSNLIIVSALGFNPESFISVEKSDLEYNLPGENISSSKNYPDGSLFIINEKYFLLEQGQLREFISPKAFSSRYSENMAIVKEADFFKAYPHSENKIGFNPSTLVSYGESVYIVAEKDIFPIDSIETFEAMGFDWNDVLPVGADEISFYEKKKLLSLSSSHPKGTVFLNSKNKRWEIIADGKKHLLPMGSITKAWNKKPIIIYEDGSDVFSDCLFTKKTIAIRKFQCQIDIEKLKNFSGKDFEFFISGQPKIRVDEINIKFSQKVGWETLKIRLSSVLRRAKNNYVGAN